MNLEDGLIHTLTQQIPCMKLDSKVDLKGFTQGHHLLWTMISGESVKKAGKIPKNSS